MTTTTHLISVIIPVYNVKHYLRQCLDSVVSQTYRNIEILIIDDGSSDGSGIICDDYALKDARVKVFHTDNLGLSAARNYGLDHKSEASEYVVFLDSDDWMEPQAIQILFNSADKYQADIVSCSFYIEYLNCQLTSSQPELKMVLEGEQSLNSFISEFYIGNAAWNKLYKAELFKSLRYPQGRLYEDVSTTYKTVLAAERVVVLPDLLIHYRIRKKSISHSHSMRVLSDRWRAYYNKYTDLSKKASDIDRCHLLVGECMNAISAMWRWYICFNHSEKDLVNPILDEMQIFAKDHFKEIIYTSEYSNNQKFAALFAKTRSPLVMGVLNLVTRLYLLLVQYESYPQ